MKFTSGKFLTVAIATALATSAFAGDGEDHHGKMHGSVKAEMRIMDTNQDGKISATEHAAGAKQMFQGMDVNRDNRVTAAEMDAAKKRMKQPADASHRPADQRHAAEMSSADKIKVVDTDSDGVLTAEEHAEGSTIMFSKMDVDTDGLLTAQEIEAGHAKMMTASDE
jgi:Ca2+-binding EF-hand superfamily protein